MKITDRVINKVLQKKRRKFYVNLYLKRIKELNDEFKDYDDPGYMATMEFEEVAIPEEVVGYWIYHEEANAFKRWRDAIKGKQLTSSDKEVDAILSSVFA